MDVSVLLERRLCALILIVLGALLVFVVGKSGSSRSHYDSAFDDDVFEEEDEGLFGEGGFEEGDFGDEEF